MDNILSLKEDSLTAITKSLAGRVKQRRLEMNATQQTLAERAGVSLASYRRFERTGEISLLSLVKIAVALNVENEFNNLFSNKIYNSIEDVLTEKKIRKRGKTNGKNR
ncbi:MAG: helix-turn-helix transcriptional regulator [Prevotellaceae bacterium]|nr:helix-turn-helix transcriptional regulator [Prevotellaceae bacterium]